MATTKPQGPVKEFQTFLTEDDRGWEGIYGMPNNYRVGEDGRETPVDPQRAQSGGLSDSSSADPPRAAPGNESPVKFDR